MQVTNSFIGDRKASGGGLGGTLGADATIMLLAATILDIVCELPLYFRSRGPTTLTTTTFALAGKRCGLRGSGARGPATSSRGPARSTSARPMTRGGRGHSGDACCSSCNGRSNRGGCAIRRHAVNSAKARISGYFIGGGAKLSLSFSKLLSTGLPFSVSGNVGSPRILVCRARADRTCLSRSISFFCSDFCSHAGGGSFGIITIKSTLARRLGGHNVGAIRSAAVRSRSCGNSCSQDISAICGGLRGCPSVGIIVSLRHSTVKASRGGIGPIFACGNGGNTRVVVLTNYSASNRQNFSY